MRCGLKRRAIFLKEKWRRDKYLNSQLHFRPRYKRTAFLQEEKKTNKQHPLFYFNPLYTSLGNDRVADHAQPPSIICARQIAGVFLHIWAKCDPRLVNDVHSVQTDCGLWSGRTWSPRRCWKCVHQQVLFSPCDPTEYGRIREAFTDLSGGRCL